MIHTKETFLKVLVEAFGDELEVGAAVAPTVNKWLERGDGVAIYENKDLSHPECGRRKFVSFGSSACQLEGEEAPKRLPDIGGEVNWRYQLIGVYRGEKL